MIGILHRLNRMRADLTLARKAHAPAPKDRSIIETPNAIEAMLPFVGSCGLCGGPDSRHRLWDSIVGRFDAGETVADLAYDFEMDPGLVRFITSYWQDGTQSWHYRAFTASI